MFTHDSYTAHHDGLLHSIPVNISKRYPNLAILLDECVHCNDRDCNNRFVISRKLLTVFEEILKDIH